MSNILFALMEEKGVPTHFVRQLSDRDTLVKAVVILPLEVIVRNVAAGHFSQRYGVDEGTPLRRSALEFSYKRDDLGDPLINDDHVLALGLATEEEIAQVKDYAKTVNEVMQEFFLDKGLKLVDFKIEFGKLSDGTIVLADEISPDTCRLWDVETNEKMDKDRFRRDLGKVEETYREVLSRVKA
jgi:phosphoribosylaminoimidazole-succinocarboxamide synthase